MKISKGTLALSLLMPSVYGVAHEKNKQTVKQPNILFIAIDDLRPELGCYGSTIAKSPSIDKLAKKGIVFNRAYCQESISGPSRASLMTGARPETIKVIENTTNFRDLNPEIITLPQQFRANGYETVYVGKIFHPPFTDPILSWSRKPVEDKLVGNRQKLLGGYALPENQEISKKNKADIIAKYGDVGIEGLGSGPAYECADVPDNTYQDGFNTDLAIATMKDMLEKNPNKPFFLGLGLIRPHLNWIAPKKYWDMYDEDKIPLTLQPHAPENAAAMGLSASFELRVREGIPKAGPIDSVLARKLRHAYLASVSYSDAQVGKMMDALEKAGILDNTIVILFGDNGWHLGDMGVWGKATNYEYATRIPLIIYTPGMKAKCRGTKSDALVELVDMYPTLCDLAGIAKPSHLEGQSFTPVLANPKAEWKKAVFSQYPDPALREWAANPLSKGMRETYFGPLIQEVENKIKAQQKGKWDRDLFEKRMMGYTMRTDQYRLVVWKDYTKPESKPYFIELYDHKTNPMETKNIASTSPEIVKKLMVQFNVGWKGNLGLIQKK